MRVSTRNVDRRQFLAGSTSLIFASSLPSIGVAETSRKIVMHPIPSSGELIPAIGMGTWITFNVGRSQTLRRQRSEVLSHFFRLGGTLVDSSPMYGSSEEVVGDNLKSIGTHSLFSATKTWTRSDTEARSQFADSKSLWGVEQFDLLQIHNLVGWQSHLPYLAELKQQGNIRYLGVTTSHGRRHDDIKHVLKSQKIDFLQLTYNLIDREAERELIPLARDKGIAVICNRPFQGGRLPRITQNAAVPDWAVELGCTSWPQLLLKFVISLPGVTVAIPATSQVAHMSENMVALQGELPDAKYRDKIMSAYQDI